MGANQLLKMPSVESEAFQLLKRPSVERATGFSRSTIYRKIQQGLFTKPVDIGGERVAWPASEVAAINRARIAGKKDPEIMELVEQLHADRSL